MVKQVFPFGAVELEEGSGNPFLVNGQRVKKYYTEEKVLKIETFHLMDA